MTKHYFPFLPPRECTGPTPSGDARVSPTGRDSTRSWRTILAPDLLAMKNEAIR